MTKEELLDKAIYWFKVIAEDMERITSGNLPHNAVTTKGRAIRAYEFLEKHKNDVEQSPWKLANGENLPEDGSAIMAVTDTCTILQDDAFFKENYIPSWEGFIKEYTVTHWAYKADVLP